MPLTLPEFPAPDIQGVMNVIKEVLSALEGETTGPISDISQAIVSIREMDCGGKWIVYVNTGLVAAGRALYMLLIPSIDEIFENYLQPKPGRRGQRRGGRGERMRRAVAANAYRIMFNPPIPDVDDAIANMLPGRGILAGRKMLPGEWVFWTAVDIADAVLWQWLLIEATETFTVTWMSELMQSGQCKFDADARCQFITPKQTPFFNNELWANQADLLDRSDKNLDIINNGEIALEFPNFEGHALCIVLAEWYLDRGNNPGDASWQVGVRAHVFDRWGTTVVDKTEYTTISGGPAAKVAALLDFSFITEEFHSVLLTFETVDILPGSFATFECWAKVALDVRGVHAV